MELRQDEKITTSQAVIGIATFVLGSEIVILPRVASDAIGTPDAWISIFLGGVISTCLGVVCAKLSLRFPTSNYYEISPKLVGKPIGFLVNLIYIFSLMMTGAYQVRIQAEVVRHYLLDDTPIAFTAICFLAVSTYLVLGGMNPMFRLFELLFPLSTFVFFLVMVLCLQDFQIENFRPVLSEGVLPVLLGLKAASLPLYGFEIILFFTPIMNEPKKAVKAVVASNSITILVYVTVLVIVIGNLSSEVVRTLTWPTIEVIRSIEIPGAFFSNFELFFIVIWVIEMYTTLVVSHYFSSLGISQLFSIKIKYCYFIVIPLIYWVAFYPKNINGVFSLGDINGYIAIFISGIVPVLLLLIAKLKSWRGQNV
ncbi:GerAB/ArcD/ProY family transporter [Brevibacillus migulae]|uniref:GerAB/ArcD/ProY family transporter n=1 Tax=Brevibacillus migulae TaxID=1644114 RepID=UPI00142F5ED1|nr:GerAB/ArcD/ProY family transporter [Brevibacillus migulae]